MFERRKAGGLLVEAVWFSASWGGRPAIFYTTLRDEGEECIG